MRTPYVRSEDGSDFTDSHPQVWLTPALREHSANFIGSPTQSHMANDIRAAEQIGSDGMVRALPARSISYQTALSMLGMDNE